MFSANESMNACHSGQPAYAVDGHKKLSPDCRWAQGLDPENPMYGRSAALSALRAGDIAGAERLFLRAILSIQRTLGADHPLMVLVAQDLAELYANQGREDEMCNLARRVVAAVSPPAIAQSNDTTLRRFADLCGKAGRLRAAIPSYRSALAFRRAMFGENHPKIAECLAGLAVVYRQLGESETSRGLLIQARLVRESGNGVQVAA